ncbi:MAG: NAD(P)-dependent oxidoreductase [Burkholderiales bacterium]|nr:NAD(P)-dependent oxidoreductase [Burkholderiales bacterium]
MKVLIVGGTSALAQILKQTLSPFAEVSTAGRSNCDITLDIGTPADRIELPHGFDVVVNAAASFGVKTFEDMLRTECVNVLGVLKLCEACAKAEVKQLVLVSSIFAGLEPTSRFYNIYAESKRHSDEIARMYCESAGLPLTIVRPSQFYGTGAAQRKHQPFLTTLIDKAARNEEIVFYGSNDAKRNFIHVEDVAHAIALLVQRKIQGTFACMSTSNVSYTEVALAAIAAFGSSSTIRFDKDKPDIPDNIFPIDETLYRLLNWYPAVQIADGMRKEAAFRKGAA